MAFQAPQCFDGESDKYNDRLDQSRHEREELHQKLGAFRSAHRAAIDAMTRSASIINEAFNECQQKLGGVDSKLEGYRKEYQILDMYLGKFLDENNRMHEYVRLLESEKKLLQKKLELQASALHQSGVISQESGDVSEREINAKFDNENTILMQQKEDLLTALKADQAKLAAFKKSVTNIAVLQRVQSFWNDCKSGISYAGSWVKGLFSRGDNNHSSAHHPSAYTYRGIERE
jgi:chromosome segregation ATPase